MQVMQFHNQVYEALLICMLMLKEISSQKWTDENLNPQVFSITTLEKLQDMWNCEELPTLKLSLS